MLSKYIPLVTVLSAGALALGCSASRDVEVTGQAGSGVSQADIVLEFFDVVGGERTNVLSSKAAADGSFTETVALEGDELLVRAVADSNGDGTCSAGEAWGEALVQVGETASVGPLSITLGFAPCPGE
jgi:hypothetical protein